MIRLILALIFLAMTFCETSSQDNIVTASNSDKAADIQMTWSVGQTFSASYTNEITLSEGMSGSNLTVSALTNQHVNLIKVKAYPNPTRDNLVVEIVNMDNQTYTAKLFTIKGELLESVETSDNSIDFKLSVHPTGTYFIKIFQNNKEFNTLKVIKQ